MIAKIDHSFNQNNTVTGPGIFFGDSTQQFPLALNATGGELPGFLIQSRRRGFQLVFSFLRGVVFSSTKLNETALWLEPLRRRILLSGPEF